jgi:hypothetical protein
MQTQPKPAVRTHRTSRAVAHREHRGNVIHWPGEALERHLRQLPLPPAPGEGNTPELIPASRQNTWLAVFAILAFLVAAGAMAGAL